MSIPNTADLLLVLGRLSDNDLEVFKGSGVEEAFGLGGEGVCPICPVVPGGEGDAVDDCHGGPEHDDGFLLDGLEAGGSGGVEGGVISCHFSKCV